MAINSIKVHRVRVLMALGDNEVPHYYHHENVTCISFHLSFPSLLDADELRAFFTIHKILFSLFKKLRRFLSRPTN